MKHPANVALKYRNHVAVARKAPKGSIVYDIKKNVDSVTLATEDTLEQTRAAIDFLIANPWAVV